ncbi:sensor histidine kinase [Treponema sp. C6A8]|uniref:sensor histidine kinase n=1 Tax=Treponema sp. C6A8 TaxID=1410609 RepID=UPI0004805295|nr:ATP-binding protein [Treponema sp. C6A8]
MKNKSADNIRREIQHTHLLLIIIITILFSLGGAAINVNAHDKAFDLNLQNTAELISRLYSFTRDYSPEDLRSYFDSVEQSLPEVDVISIVDKSHIRLYHTNHALIGTLYDGKVPDLTQHQNGFYTESDIGPSGPQRRTYYALFDKDGNYDGFLMAIVLKTTIHSITIKTIMLFAAITLGAILIEFFLSKGVSHKIKKRLLGFEPDTFTSMYKIRDNILESINDGIIAIDRHGNIQFSNGVAKKILNCCGENEKVELIKKNVFAEKFLMPVISDGTSQFGLQETLENKTPVLIDCIPIKEENSVIGAAAILHDRTEYTKLMEDLSGTKYLVDSMRANNHDFTNKLHVILGLIQIGQYEKAVSYIENISIIQRETLSVIMHAVDNATLAALLIGKIARSSECNVRFILREGISYKNSDINLPSEALVTIVGNLIDNALDSMNSTNSDLRELEFGVFTQPGELLITVDDTGCGIAPENYENVFLNGFSTKGKGRGVGLYHTKQLIESLGGNISFESQVGVGTSFMVTFKKNGSDSQVEAE